MTSPLQSLIKNLKERFPNELPPKHTELSELSYLQGNQEVVEYVISFLKANEEELNRDSILSGS